ncbi:class A beta-lactamase [Nocardia goodfellowii]|uniref:Beta-lactamase n=1 Tax=Nocardia goodfellowii TaxID=882446 RepID=A0ABS4QJI5_9NOCA|nr:class A beta-lactamase [Nocardia goodfellowii]MBP2190826.1 beta-lactamase class A [Nocardia goodfellowii]
MIKNKSMVLLLAALLPLAGACGSTATEPAAVSSAPAVASQLADLESRHQARLGVFGIDTGSGKTVGHRADERFPMLSTFKTLACAALLKTHPLASGYYEQVIRFTEADVAKAEGSAVTGKRIATGMTVRELCDAAIAYSDNAAANEILKLLGGPQAVTEFLRGIGDQVSRLDRWEPEVNTAIPGDERDTTTPAAIARDYQVLTLGDALPAPERDQLVAWLKASTTGGSRIRAGLPADWTTGDKTGTSSAYGSANDVAVTWPAGGGAPIVIAVLSTHADANAPLDNPLVAAAAKDVAAVLR